MEEIINSVMQSPENTNPNVLRSQLKAVQGEGGSGYNPYIIEIENRTGVTGTTTAVFEDAKEAFLQNRPVIFSETKSDGSAIRAQASCLTLQTVEGTEIVMLVAAVASNQASCIFFDNPNNDVYVYE